MMIVLFPGEEGVLPEKEGVGNDDFGCLLYALDNVSWRR